MTLSQFAAIQESGYIYIYIFKRTRLIAVGHEADILRWEPIRKESTPDRERRIDRHVIIAQASCSNRGWLRIDRSSMRRVRGRLLAGLLALNWGSDGWLLACLEWADAGGVSAWTIHVTNNAPHLISWTVLPKHIPEMLFLLQARRQLTRDDEQSMVRG